MTPGHPDAIKAGCVCTHPHNMNGARPDGVYMVHETCPIHADDGTPWLVTPDQVRESAS